MAYTYNSVTKRFSDLGFAKLILQERLDKLENQRTPFADKLRRSIAAVGNLPDGRTIIVTIIRKGGTRPPWVTPFTSMDKAGEFIGKAKERLAALGLDDQVTFYVDEVSVNNDWYLRYLEEAQRA